MPLTYKFTFYLLSIFLLYGGIKGLRKERLYFFDITAFRWTEKAFWKGKETIFLNVSCIIFGLILLLYIFT